jgi:LL-diaminopimelate aminotransferase
MALCDPSEIILVPSPCYPIFSIGPALCGARVEYYKLDPANDWQPDLDGIDPEIAKAAKAIIVSFPNNPTCSVLPDSFYHKLIEFANKYEIIVIHDNAYSEIYFDGNKPGSFLAFPGAKEVGVEFNSLSKTYNLTGARLSFLLGNAEIVGRFRDVRSQIDYGSFLPGQYAAIAALEGPQESVAQHRAEYQRRRDTLCGGLEAIGWKGVSSKATMFAWAPLPAGYTDSAAFCAELIERSGVICTPGAAFGPGGEGYVRFALVLPPEKLEEAIKAVDACGILK